MLSLLTVMAHLDLNQAKIIASMSVVAGHLWFVVICSLAGVLAPAHAIAAQALLG
jgi:hypothetical protein